ncbi:hypothetical protein RhiirB3_450601 [Rhizophagus irregularis]|nr:hypothetical protein RhiirB3_450601 [Rhizophagus irregularis]
MQCFYNFKKDTSENQIIVLKPNYEFLKWKVQIELGRYTSKRLDPFFLFYYHYAEAMNHSQKKSIKYKKLKSEVIKAWNNADKVVHKKYNELASLFLNLNLGLNFSMKTYFKSEIKTINFFVTSDKKLASIKVLIQ